MLDPRLLLCLDEAGNIAAIPELPELATTGRGQGIQLLSIFHDLGNSSTATANARPRWSTDIGRSCSCRAKPTPAR
jgi:TraM recognition site of TraD and TraG